MFSLDVHVVGSFDPVLPRRVHVNKTHRTVRAVCARALVVKLSSAGRYARCAQAGMYPTRRRARGMYPTRPVRMSHVCLLAAAIRPTARRGRPWMAAGAAVLLLLPKSIGGDGGGAGAGAGAAQVNSGDTDRWAGG